MGYKIKFERYYEGKKSEVVFTRNSEDIIHIDIGGIESKVIRCKEIERTLLHFNDNSDSKYREAFTAYFCSDKNGNDIARQIGIIDSLGHFFLQTYKLSNIIPFIIECFNNISGFTFIDWQDRGDNQLLYVTSKEVESGYLIELEKMFNNGIAGKISLNISDCKELKTHYVMQSADLDNRHNQQAYPVINIIITTINGEIKERFSGKSK